MTDLTDAPSFKDLLAVPVRTAEVLLAPGASIRADWRTNGIPLLTTETTGCLPILLVKSGRNLLVIGFGPHEELGPEHAALVDQLALEAQALAVQVGRIARSEMIDPQKQTGLEPSETCAFPPWRIHVHLRPEHTQIKMMPCEGDVPPRRLCTAASTTNGRSSRPCGTSASPARPGWAG
jgi:hypothetical protein